MFARTPGPGTGFIFVVSLGLALPTAARADEVYISLGPRTRVPIGPAGTVAEVRRLQVQGRRYVTVSAPTGDTASRCGAPLQRVTVWEELPGHTWIESLSDTYDLCTHTPGELRGLTVGVVNGPEAHVLLTAPHTPAETGTLVRYRRSGDRFIGPHREGPIAAAPDETPRGVLAPAPAMPLTADLAPWRDREPLVSSQGVRVWAGIEGRSMRFAAHLPADSDGALTLVLAEAGISTDVLHSGRDNHGRFLTVRCDGDAPPDAEVRCRRVADGVDLEGRTDLGTMVWASPTVSSVAVYAQVGEGSARIASDPNFRLHPFTLPVPMDVLAGASPEARAACADARFRTWVPPRDAADAAGLRVVACGARCSANDCERHAVADPVPRMALTRGPQGFCVAVTGPGSESVHTCSAGGDHARLIGLFPLVGFSTVAALDREVLRADGAAHRTEVWALVSPSAAWQRLWQGAERAHGATPRLDTTEIHPRFCTDGTACEIADAVTLAPADPGGAVTASFARLGLSAGLRQPPRF